MKRRIAFFLAMVTALSMVLPSVPSALAVENEDVLEPADLHFRKYYTGRNLFDSEIPIGELDLTDGPMVLENQEAS